MANRYFVNGGVDNNWGTSGNWSLTDGGAGGQTVPSSSDDVFFTSNSPNCTLNTTARAAKTLTTTGYTNTLTFNVNLAVSGSITIGSGTNFAGSSLLRMITTGTWTTNGKTIGVPVEIGGTTTFTCTLADALTVSGALTLTNSTSTTFSGAFAITAGSCTISGSQTVTIVADVTISGTLTIADNNVLNGAFNWNCAGLTMTGDITSGTSTVNMTGGTWSGAGTVGCALKFAGNVTVSGTVHIGASGIAVTYVSGTITTTGSTLSIDTATTLDTNGISWNNVTITAAVTVTINSRLTVTGTLTLPNAAVTFAGSQGWTAANVTNTAYTASRTITLAESVEYICTTSWTQDSTDLLSEVHTLTSAHATTKTIVTLQGAATQYFGAYDFTRIDARSGQPLYTNPNRTITSCFNCSNSLGAGGNIIATAGGETATLSGVTKDDTGAALASCDVFLFKYSSSAGAARYIGATTSDGSGNYSFSVFPTGNVSTYFVVAFKGGATPVMDVTDRTLSGV